MYVKCLMLSKRRLGPDDPDTLNTENNLAILYVRGNKLDDAEPLYEVSTVYIIERIDK